MQSTIAKHLFPMLFLALTAPNFAAAGADLRVRPLEWAQPVIGFDLGNFHQVSEDVFRSQQPDDEALRALEKAGFRAVLNLREYHSDDQEAASLDLYRVPMDAGKVSDTEIARALKILAEAPKPVLVHCWHGSDRTGVVVAMYRMVFQNWPRDKAIDEFVNGGYGYHKSFYPNIEAYLETVDVQRFQRSMLSSSTSRGGVHR